MNSINHNRRGIRTVPAALALLAMGVMAGCRDQASQRPPSGQTITRQQQQAMTPDQALNRLMDGNRRFVAGRSTSYDYPAQRQATCGGQYPFAVIISCLDSRAAPELLFDQGIGDIFVARVAGNYAPVDIIGSTEFGTQVAGAALVMVLGHTECGAIKGACDNVVLGNLTTVIQALRPAVNDATGIEGDHNSKNPRFVQAAADANVRRTVETLRQKSDILRDLEAAGRIKLVGAMYDLSTGQVKVLD